MQYPVIIVDYNPEWPKLFEQEKKLLEKLCAKGITAIEHVGSTAVPGLAAKPIIDIMIGVESLEDGKLNCIGPLQAIGYHYVPELEGDIPERYFLFRGSSKGHSHHIHITEPTTAFWIDHILFRDYLRKYKEVANAYAQLKQKLAKQFRNQREKYGMAKTDFIEDVLEKARVEFT
jgi:GrpB-like predicted nucleotidyltransferase (UPF0157 family)